LLAEGKRPPVVELPDRTVRHDRRLNLRAAAEHTVSAEFLVQRIDMGNSIQERQYISSRRYGWYDRRDCGIKIVRLAGQITAS
jgi:hypothetical protein